MDGAPQNTEGGAAHMKAEALAHLALGMLFVTAYRELLAQESPTGAGLRPLLAQLSLDLTKVVAALEGVEHMALKTDKA